MATAVNNSAFRITLMPKSASESVKEYIRSSWTPLSESDINDKFKSWSENQRRQVFLELLGLCSSKQLEFMEAILQDKVPIYKIDFTRVLPKVLSLYIFSFLDPRSLSRCAQVCWYWKYLADANEIWASKCLRKGWNISLSPHNYDQTTWKAHYIHNMHYLQVAAPIKSLALELMKRIETAEENAKRDAKLALERTKAELQAERQKLRRLEEENKMSVCQTVLPWKAPDRNPIDTRRLNYLANDFTKKQRTRQRPTVIKETKFNHHFSQQNFGRIICETGPSLTNSARTGYSQQHELLSRESSLVIRPRGAWRPTSKYLHPTDTQSRKLVEECNETTKQNNPVKIKKRHPSNRLQTGNFDENPGSSAFSGKTATTFCNKLTYLDTSAIQKTLSAAQTLPMTVIAVNPSDNDDIPPPKYPVCYDVKIESIATTDIECNQNAINSSISTDDSILHANEVLQTIEQVNKTSGDTCSASVSQPSPRPRKRIESRYSAEPDCHYPVALASPILKDADL